MVDFRCSQLYHLDGCLDGLVNVWYNWIIYDDFMGIDPTILGGCDWDLMGELQKVAPRPASWFITPLTIDMCCVDFP